MGPYLLFAGDVYYPAGGWHDYRGSFASVPAARHGAERLSANDDLSEPWAHVVDSATGLILDYTVDPGEWCSNLPMTDRRRRDLP